ncbi:50S ribosomal protein L15 [Spiroplasma endosymbiont of Amphibalanus improvisus]|uniref:50S ribosomal protein L15 n=1 Tax=Spiroplasma endosymbiont of Amphibalanus improvisus TaxID=3066327 RepID=UPI00313B81D7
MELHNLKSTEGSRHNKKRLGRGSSSGTGKTSGRGQKGQKARSGGGTRPGFEGGQTPIYRRIPKFGFTNINTKKYTILNLDQIEKMGISEINHETLIDKKIISSKKNLIKILGNGNITKKINLKVNKISGSAAEKIKKAGGTIVVINEKVEK